MEPEIAWTEEDLAHFRLRALELERQRLLNAFMRAAPDSPEEAEIEGKLNAIRRRINEAERVLSELMTANGTGPMRMGP